MSGKLNALRELAIPFPIPPSFRQQARAYASQYFTESTQKRIYLNTLAVLVADAYFRLLGFETNMTAPERWNAAYRLWSEANELQLSELGNLECCVISTEQQDITIPLESLSGNSYFSETSGQERSRSNNACIGYLFVEIASTEKEAMLVGFLPVLHPEITNAEAIATHLQSMDDLIDYLAQQEITLLSGINQTDNLTREFAEKKITYLRNWLNNTYEVDWEPLTRDLRTATCKKKIQLAGQFFALQLSISQSNDKLILVRVIVQGERAALPIGMQVSVPDEDDIYTETVNELADLISIPLELSPGEEFWVELRLGEAWIKEFFIV
ncbi:DUF1822 family protein [Tolypothrix bouteillei VB521301_2]|uniref:DUF1822 domain-containing protein n=1 Tax=Tolypothrix bouteillei VB521301 TaxID=1479485 RepID=A0A0C1N5T5_9CYAN